MNELLSLKWNNHSTALLKKLDNLLARDSYADATISCHGKYFPVHRLVLSTCSEYFEEIFEKTKCKHPFIIVQDIDATILEALLSYMYKGKVNVLQDVLPKLIKAAESLKIKGLAVSDDPLEDEAMQKNDKKRSTSLSSPVPSYKKVKKDKECNNSNKSKNENKLAEQDNTSLIDSHNCLSTRPNNNEVHFVRNIKKESQDQSDNPIEEIQGVNATVKCTGVDSDISACYHKLPTPELFQTDKLNKPSSVPVHSSQMISSSSKLQYSIERSANDSSSPSFTSQPIEGSNPLYNIYVGDINDIDKSAPIIKCQWSHCTFTHSDYSVMESHLISRHSWPNPYCCMLCDFHSSAAVELKNHINNIHIREKLFPCHKCEYVADSFSNVAKHFRVHTGEKPFQCQYCDYRTTQNNNLYRHIRTHHS